MSKHTASPASPDDLPEKPESKESKGGKARAKNLTPEQRTEIAKAAAQQRWQKPVINPNIIPSAEYPGILKLGDVDLECYVLSDGRRVFSKRAMAKALGLKSEGGNAFIKTISGKGIGSNIGMELWDKINNPIIFNPLTGDLGHGNEVTVLIDVCDAIIQYRNSGPILPAQYDLAEKAEMIIRASAKVGIIALVDEATGYIADKKKEEYREMWLEFIREEFREYKEEFPPQFFDMIYKVYNLKRTSPGKHPQFFGKFIRRYIYEPLAGSRGAILKELDSKNPVVYTSGGRRYKMFQFLSDQVGLNALRAHIWQTVGIGNSVKNKDQFKRSFDIAFPDPTKPQQGELGLDI